MTITQSSLPDVQKKPGKIGERLIKLLDFLTSFGETFGAILLAIMTLTITWQVITRFKVIHMNSPWTEEIALVLLVWFGLIGSAIGVRKNSHISVEFVAGLFPNKVQHIFRILIHFIIMTFSLFLFIEGILLAQGSWFTIMPATMFQRGMVVYTAIPVAASLMFFYSTELLIKEITSTQGGQNHA